MRFASQLTFCSPIEIHRRMVVEQNEEGCITQLFSMDNGLVESAHTLFFDGIISVGIRSVKKQYSNYSTELKDYHYLDFSEELNAVIVPNEKPLLIDFGTESTEIFNMRLLKALPKLSAFSAYEIIAACTYYPALFTGETGSLSVNGKHQLIIWEGLDLVNKRVTNRTQIKEIGKKSELK